MISRKSRGQCKQRERKHEAGTETDSINSQFGAILEMDSEKCESCEFVCPRAHSLLDILDLHAGCAAAA